MKSHNYLAMLLFSCSFAFPVSSSQDEFIDINIATPTQKVVGSFRSPRVKTLEEQEVRWARMEEEDRIQQTRWLQQQTLFSRYNASTNRASVTAAMQNLGINEQPFAFGPRSYIQHPDGTTTYSRYKSSVDPLTITDYGLRVHTLAYVAGDNEGHHETFTPTRSKGQTFQESRNHPFDAFSLMVKGTRIDFDAGHGIDQADTVVANGRNSSTTYENFIPQNRYYNQMIRNHIVNHAVRPTNGSYKEISIYDHTDPLIHTLSKGQKCHIPIGFIFVIFKNHEIERMFYFPNLISYEKLLTNGIVKRGYKNFMNHFEIPKDVLSNSVVTAGNTDAHTRAVYDQGFRGYRSLSGRYDPVKPLKIPRPAKAALRRYLAIYHMEQAAHLEYRGVEDKAELVRTYTSNMKYYALDKATKEERAEKQQAYFQAYKDEEKKLAESYGIVVDLLDYGINIRRLCSDFTVSADDPIELALKRVRKVQEEFERGQSLYNPERAKIWLARIEESVRQSPRIEDIIQLLDLYDIPEVQDQDKKREFEALLEEQGNTSTLEQQKEIGDYFHFQLTNSARVAELIELQQKVEKWKAIVEENIEVSDSIEELTEAAEWYHGGRGMFTQDIDKAREIYEKLIPHVKRDEQRRIRYCLNDLNKIEDYKRKTVENAQR